MTTEFFDYSVNNFVSLNNRFKEFYRKNKTIIDSKINSVGKDENNLSAILAELEFASLILLNKELDVDFVPTINKGKQVKGNQTPDFLITTKNEKYYAEVKRLGWTEAERQHFEVESLLTEEIEKIPSSLCVYMHIDHLDGGQFQNWAEFFTDFIKELQIVVNEIQGIIRRMQCEMSVDDPIRNFTLSIFTGMLTISITRPGGKIDKSKTSFDLGVHPIYYKQNEDLKFLDLIIDSLGQLSDNHANVLYVRCENNTYNGRRAQQALEDMFRDPPSKFVRVKFEKKEISDKDRQESLQKLSVFHFRNNWGALPQRVFQWANPTARYELPNSIASYLQSMEHK